MKTSKPAGPFARFSKPAQRALDNAGIEKLEDLSRLTEKEFKALHGMGPATTKPLMAQMEEAGLKFKNQ
ncbi:helix-hairpin-helix domain-containing protein [Mucilaginibacter boryungensis]|uniref:DNA-binding protein n=1 Tax=Mucilaginibacter boryungensis TaxID=768480 RepID=A0ABR9XKD9_9SPHI|nr:hypothetical protein [Mucilaginibacter boryungensis]MBE9667862.1 hypothetical protein [Mucilaginibacter boryungensis]